MNEILRAPLEMYTFHSIDIFEGLKKIWSRLWIMICTRIFNPNRINKARQWICINRIKHSTFINHKIKYANGFARIFKNFFNYDGINKKANQTIIKTDLFYQIFIKIVRSLMEIFTFFLPLHENLKIRE